MLQQCAVLISAYPTPPPMPPPSSLFASSKPPPTYHKCTSPVVHMAACWRTANISCCRSTVANSMLLRLAYFVSAGFAHAAVLMLPLLLLFI